MNTHPIIEPASPEDASAIFSLMEYARVENEKKGFFCADTIAYIEEHIKNPQKGFLLKASSNNELAGFFILHIPHMDENNMGSYRNLPLEEYEKVVHFDSAVVNPKYRGQRIMDAFLTKTEELLQNMPYTHYFATVHPDNSNSYRNLINHGFQIVTTTKKYGGLTRHVMYKSK